MNKYLKQLSMFANSVDFEKLLRARAYDKNPNYQEQESTTELIV
jgi:hypothetical protein